LIDRSEDDFKTFVAGFSNSSSASQNQVVTPFDGAYAQARQESDPLFIKYPYLVVYCMVPADIRHAIKFANGDGKKQKRIPICARSGGHSTAGFSIIDQGMIIDVSRMKGIFVDTEDHRYNKPENDGKTSYNEVGRPALPYGGTVLVQTGANWGVVKCELQAHARHVPCETTARFSVCNRLSYLTNHSSYYLSISLKVATVVELVSQGIPWVEDMAVPLWEPESLQTT